VSATTDRELNAVVEPSELREKCSPVGLLYVRIWQPVAKRRSIEHAASNIQR